MSPPTTSRSPSTTRAIAIGGRIRFRRAREEDCGLLWEWANDPTVRAESFFPDPIPWDAHVEWFTRKLQDPGFLLLIAVEDAGDAIGQVRFETAGKEAEISVSVERGRRGCGYGSRLIEMAVAELFAAMPVRTVHAFIRPENPASIRAFEKARFTHIATRNVQGRAALHYALERAATGRALAGSRAMNAVPQIRIAGRCIGAGQPVYVVAEMSANHNRSFDRAVRILHAAKEAGADAVKLQTYSADTMTVPSGGERFSVAGGTPWDGRTLHELYSEASMPWEWQPTLKGIADDLELDLFSTAFDSTAVDFLESMRVPLHKVASFEIVDLPLIEKMAGTGKPLILSTGLATLDEIGEAVKVARGAGAAQIALLKCTSAYPAPPEEMHLRTIPHLMEAFHVPVGLSDHTLGIAVPPAAAALGACIVEKHLTLSRETPGPDSAFSLEPQEFKEMVRSVRVVEKALGEIHYGETAHQASSRVFRRSLFVVEDVEAGEEFTPRNVRSIRPGYGLHPRNLADVLGRCATRRIARGAPLTWDMVVGAGIAAACGEPTPRTTLPSRSSGGA